MSRPRLSHQELARSPSPPQYKTVPIRHQHVLSRSQNGRPFILFAHNEAYTQLPNLPRLPGQVGFAGDPLPKKRRRVPHPQMPHNEPVVGDLNNDFLLHPPEPLEAIPSKNVNKKVRQWKRWQDSVLPSLIQPYLQLLATSESLSAMGSIVFPRCSCGSARKINSVMVSFTIMQSISFHSCQCLPPVAEQLVSQGLFPCAPLLPSLVVDVRLLDLASRLFLHMPPNNTAWCKTLEEFLSSLGFRLKREDNLRRRFENALRWYSMLKHLTSYHVSLQVESTRSRRLSNVLATNTILPSITPIVSIPPAQTLLAERLVRATPHHVNSGVQPRYSTISPISRIPQADVACSKTPSVSAGIPVSSRSKQGLQGSIRSHHNTHPVEGTATNPTITDRQNRTASTSRTALKSQDHNAAEQEMSGHSVQTPAISNASSHKRSRSESQSSSNVKESPETPFPTPESRTRPSEYLRKRCPLCFGGEFPSSVAIKPDAIVCLDACFTQKRNKGPRDPERIHPESSFIPETDLQRMQSFVEAVRTPKETVPKSKRQCNVTATADEPEDVFEGNLAVPVSVLDGCESSFTAADERREKASTKFFDDTALMALLCRHDRVLWIANMRSAGEKQHYALALLETLFQHLPLTFVIGLLYDIGCQLHRSCVKWGFLKPYLDRIMFGISVFHAFGHQWACQLVYHPRKCVGFGLSDGEGCERFWHSISKLIPVLRVSGFHQRLYVLDAQVQHLDHTSLKRLGHWLARRTQHCQKKRLAAEKALVECGQPETLLREQWAMQVHTQTRPLPRRSKNQGKNAVEEVIRLRKAYEIQKKHTYEIEQQLMKDSDGYLHALAEVDIHGARQALKRIEGQLRTKQQLLGVSEKARLSHLINNPYISLRMNALALKTRLRDRLRARKFELDPIERMGRKFTHNTHKLHAQTDSSVRRRDPTIQEVARAYNKLCDEMTKLAREKKAPTGSICPVKVPLERLFSLDVDDTIWQDIGLTDDPPTPATTSDQTTTPPQLPPAWLSKEEVRDGIKAMLERDRCIEEEARLVHERRAMQFWFHEEWRALSDGINSTDDDVLRYALEQQKKELSLLHVLWSDKVDNLQSGSTSLPAWGPTEGECVEARVKYFIPSVHSQPKDSDSSSDSSSDGDIEEYDSEHEGTAYDDIISVMDIVAAAYPSEGDGEELDIYSELFT